MNQSKKILLVDDNAIVALTESNDLKKAGYEVVTVLSGDQAVRQMRIDPGIDLILMDIDLGDGIDGTEAAEIILKERDLPIVFLSSHTETVIVERTEKITSYGYVIKNSGDTVLLASIKMAFRLFEATQKLKDREKALQESGGKLEATLNALPDLMFEVDQDFIIREFYSSSQEKHFSTPENILNKGISDILPDEAAQTIILSLSKAFAHGSDSGALYHLDSPEGRRWYELSIAVKKPAVIHENKSCIVLVRDVTLRIQAEIEKKDSDDRYRRLIENMNDMVCEIDSEGTFLYLSPQYSANLGYEPSELLGKSASEILDTEQIKMAGPRLTNVVENKLSSRDLWRFRHKNGGWRWLECVSQAYQNSSGEDRVVVISRDITDKRNAEEEIIQSRNLLEESQRVARVGHYVFDINKGLWTSSATLDKLFGIDQDYCRTVENWLGIIHPDERQEMQIYLNDHVLVHKNPFDREYRIQRIEDQRIRWVHGLGKLEMDLSGQPVRMFGVIQDITERKEAEKALSKAVDEKSALLRELQHRIKNTMVMIMSLISLQVENQENKEPFLVLKNRIQSIADLYAMLYQVNNYQEVDLSSYIGSVMEGLKNWGNGAQIEYNIQPVQVTSKFAMSIGLIMNELTTNALKYANTCKSGARISVSLESDQGRISLAVNDTGGCLPEGFDIKKSAGLGLKLVRILSSQYGGELSLRNSDGTCFMVQGLSE